jgi:hypothetical protein
MIKKYFKHLSRSKLNYIVPALMGIGTAPSTMAVRYNPNVPLIMQQFIDNLIAHRNVKSSNETLFALDTYSWIHPATNTIYLDQNIIQTLQNKLATTIDTTDPVIIDASIIDVTFTILHEMGHMYHGLINFTSVTLAIFSLSIDKGLRYDEKLADQFACSYLSPQERAHIANEYYKKHRKFLQSINLHILIPTEKTDLHKLYALYATYRNQYPYGTTIDNQELFFNWIEGDSKKITSLYRLFDPEHPSYLKRSQRIKAYMP